MNKVFTLATLLSIFTLNILCQNNTTAASNKFVSISGIVVSKTDKRFLTNASIKIQKHTTDPIELMKAEIKSARSDENGRWTFKDLAPGEYRITVSQAEIEKTRATSNAEGARKLSSVAKIVTLKGDVRDLMIELPLESTISGNTRLKPAAEDADFYIIATDEQQGIVSGAPVTDGKFLIENLSGGTFYLNLTAENGFHVVSIKRGAANFTESPIELKDGEKLSGVDIEMSNEVGHVKGKVIGFDLDEIILIVLLPLKFTGQNSLRSSIPEAAGETGEFQLNGPAGEYYLAAVTPDQLGRRTKDNAEIWYKEITKDAVKIVINVNQTTTVELNIPR